MPPTLKKLHDPLVSLSGALRKAADSGLVSSVGLRSVALEGAGTFRDALKGFALQNGFDLPQVARNVASTAPVETLGGFAVLLKYWLVTERFEEAEELDTLVKTLLSKHKEDEIFGWLLGVSSQPSWDSFEAFFGRSLRILLLFELEVGPRAGGKLTPTDTVRLLQSIVGKRYWNYGENPYAILIENGFGKGMAALDEGVFEKLPKGLRRWILADRAFTIAALSDPLHQRILSNPDGHPDTPKSVARAAWLRNYPKALKNLGIANIKAAAVGRMFAEDVFTIEFFDEILGALRDGLSSKCGDSVPRRIPSNRALHFGTNERLKLIVDFFSSAPENRLRLLEAQTESAISCLERDISEPEWIAAVLRCVDESALIKLRLRVLRKRRQVNEVIRRLGEPQTSEACRSIFARDAMSCGKREAVASLLSAQPSLFRLLTPQDLGKQLLAGIVADQMKDRGCFDQFLSNADDELIRAVMTVGMPSIRIARSELLRQVRVSTDTSFRLLFFRIALTHAPSLLENCSSLRLLDEEFLILMDNTPEPSGLNALFKLRVRRGIPAWEICFRGGKSDRTIRNKIQKHLPDLLPRLDELQAERLLESPEFKATLQKVLAGKTSPRHLRVPQRMLRHFVPWARKTWRKKPTLAAAHELALAFSIADARYLAFLCTERWNSPDRDRSGHVFDHRYRVHTLPKKSGGSRLVTAPEAPLKRLQRRILRSALDELFLHPAAHGFRSGRSILTNALPHVGRNCVVNVDIKSFFPSTSYPLILRACSMLAGGVLSEGTCRILADLCSYAGGLPTGAPTSPALANLILRSADSSIAKSAGANSITYTRYADDLTFSGGANVPRILPFVTKVLGQLGYVLDQKKTNIFRRGRRQMVTGLVVNEKPNLPRRIRRRLRAAVHTAVNGGEPRWDGKPITTAELQGRLGHLALVQPAEAASLKRKLAKDPPAARTEK